MSQKSKIVLVAGSASAGTPRPPYQLAAAYAVSYAKAHEELARAFDFDILQLPYGTEHDIDKLVEYIVKQDPVLVGFSCYIFNASVMLPVASRLKEVRPRTRVLFGGPNVSGDEKITTLKKFPFIDHVIAEEGEIAFKQLLYALLENPHDEDGLQGVQNLVFRRDGEIVANPVGPRIKIETIPSPYLAGIMPHLASFDGSPPRIPHLSDLLPIWETNRGCPYRCAFCYWGGPDPKVERFEIERLEEELKLFFSNGVKGMMLADANFGILPRDEEVIELLCRINAEYGHPLEGVHVDWAKKLNKRHFKIARMFVDNHIENTFTVAFQTLTPEAIEKTKRKSASVEEAKIILAEAERNDIRAISHLIWGLPGESVDEFLTGLDKVVEMGFPICWVFTLYLLPGTDMYDRREELGLETLGNPEYPFGEQIVISHPKMSQDDQRRGIRFSHAHYLLYNFKTAHIVNRYLDVVHGIKPSDIYRALTRYLDESRTGWLSDAGVALQQKLKGVVDQDADAHGALSYVQVELGRALWESRESAMELYEDFYLRYVRALRSTRPDASFNWEIVRDLVRFNLLIAPWPSEKGDYEVATFDYDIGGSYQAMIRSWRVGDVEWPELEARKVTYRFHSPTPGRPNNKLPVHWARYGEAMIWKVEEVGEAGEADYLQPAEDTSYTRLFTH